MLGIYLSALKRMPLTTKALTSGVLFAIGDGVNQSILQRDASKSRKYDFKGALIFTAYGALYYAPTNHLWFAWMENNFTCGTKWSSKPMLQALARVALHSTLFAPFSIVSVFIWSGYFSGQSTSRIIDIVSPSNMLPVWLVGRIFWVPTMLGIYRFVPLHLRVPTAAAASVFWSTYLSFMKTTMWEEKSDQ
jgi:hypothetical protein